MNRPTWAVSRSAPDSVLNMQCQCAQIFGKQKAQCHWRRVFVFPFFFSANISHIRRLGLYISIKLFAVDICADWMYTFVARFIAIYLEWNAFYFIVSLELQATWSDNNQRRNAASFGNRVYKQTMCLLCWFRMPIVILYSSTHTLHLVILFMTRGAPMCNSSRTLPGGMRHLTGKCWTVNK